MTALSEFVTTISGISARDLLQLVGACRERGVSSADLSDESLVLRAQVATAGATAISAIEAVGRLAAERAIVLDVPPGVSAGLVESAMDAARVLLLEELGEPIDDQSYRWMVRPWVVAGLFAEGDASATA